MNPMGIARRLRNTAVARTPIGITFMMNFLQGMLGITVVMLVMGTVMNQNLEIIRELEGPDLAGLMAGVTLVAAVGLAAGTAFLASIPRSIRTMRSMMSGQDPDEGTDAWSMRPSLNYTWPAGILTAWLATQLQSLWNLQEAAGWAMLASLILMGIGAVTLLSMSWLLTRDCWRQFREWRNGQRNE